MNRAVTFFIIRIVSYRSWKRSLSPLYLIYSGTQANAAQSESQYKRFKVLCSEKFSTAQHIFESIVLCKILKFFFIWFFLQFACKQVSK